MAKHVTIVRGRQRERVTIESDHKPLETKLKRHWHQHHQDYKESYPECRRIYTLKYKPEKELVLPDMLSRAPVPETACGITEEEIALHVHLLTSNLPVSKPKLEEIKLR